MFHLKTNDLHTDHKFTLDKTPTVSIQSMHFVFPFCPMVVVPVSKQTWETEATLLSDFSAYLPVRVKSLSLFTQLPTLDDFFNVKFNLGNLIPRLRSSLLDRGIAEFIFRNATFVTEDNKTCFCCKSNLVHNSELGNIERFERTEIGTYYELPHFIMSEGNIEILINTHQDKYTFLSCGDSYNEPPNFQVLFMPFTKLTWALIFVTIFGWPFVLSLIENEFNLKNVPKDFDALFIGWALILEQSHLRAGNYKMRGSLYCYCGCLLVAIFILSNAYKGDNIRAIVKSFELVPLTHMSNLIQAGYKTYGVKTCMGLRIPGWLDIMEKSTGYDGCLNEFYYQTNFSTSEYTDKQLKLWKPMDYKYKDNYGFPQRQLDFLRKCQKTALLHWRSVLEPLEKQLLEMHEKAIVYLGQEFIFTQSSGWRLRRYGSIKVLKRMWTLVESGVHNELLKISYKPPVGAVYEPRRITIHGNIFVQFDFHSFGLLLALLVFFVEFHKRINLCFSPVRIVIGFLVGNFVIQARKAIMQAFKIYKRMTNNFIDSYRHYTS